MRRFICIVSRLAPHPIVRSVSPLALNKDTFPKVVTVIKTSIESSATFAIHACLSTLILSGKDIVTHLKSLETEDLKVEQVYFAALKADGPALKPAMKEKEKAEIEGAGQIATGIKKDSEGGRLPRLVPEREYFRAERVWICVLSTFRAGFVEGGHVGV